MAIGPITIDAESWLKRAEAHEAEAERLRNLYDAFVAEVGARPSSPISQPPNKPKGGRRKGSGLAAETLRRFIEPLQGQIKTDAMWSAMQSGGISNRSALMPAIKILQAEGLLRVIDEPYGRKAGTYERISAT